MNLVYNENVLAYELSRIFTDENSNPFKVMSVDKQTPNIVYVFPPNSEIMICDLNSNVSRCTGSGICKFDSFLVNDFRDSLPFIFFLLDIVSNWQNGKYELF